MLDAPLAIEQGAARPSGRRRTTTQVLALRRCARPRAVAQPDDRPARPGHRHELIGTIPRRFGVYDHLVPLYRWRSAPARRRCCASRRPIVPSPMAASRSGRRLIDRIQDRFGKTIWRHDNAPATAAMRRSGTAGRTGPGRRPQQIIDPQTAYQITSMLEGVVQRGTGTSGPKVWQAARRQDRHHQRREGRLVRRLLARSRRRRVCRLRQSAHRWARAKPVAGSPRRCFAISCKLGAGRQAGDAVPRSARHQARPHRRQDGHAGAAGGRRRPFWKPISRNRGSARSRYSYSDLSRCGSRAAATAGRRRRHLRRAVIPGSPRRAGLY